VSNVEVLLLFKHAKVRVPPKSGTWPGEDSVALTGAILSIRTAPRRGLALVSTSQGEVSRLLPLHAPVDGQIPQLVARWTPVLQVSWFSHHGEALVQQAAPRSDPQDPWDVRCDLPFGDFYVTSVEHRGCCTDRVYVDRHGGGCCSQSPKSRPSTPGFYYNP
jgi:hypothetical protein